MQASKPKQFLQNIVRLAFSEIGATIALGITAFGVLAFALIADETLEGG